MKGMRTHGSLDGCLDLTAASSSCLRHPACPFIAVTPLFDPDEAMICLLSSGTLLLHSKPCQNRDPRHREKLPKSHLVPPPADEATHGLRLKSF